VTKAAEMGKISAKGSFHLLWGLVISTLISSIATILIARLLGSDLYGLYGIVLISPNLFGVFRDWGMNSAMVKYTAQFRSEDRESEVRSILLSGLIFELALGIALSAISFALSGYLATNVFHRPQITSLIQIASITILATGITNAATATFTGIERMQLNSIMLICQSSLRTAIMITLVLLGLSTAGAVLGYTVALVLTGLIGLILVWTQFKGLPKPNGIKLEIKAYTKTMLSYSTPLSLSVIINSFQAQFYSFLLPIFYVTSNSAIGNYGIASTFVVLISFFSTPITTMLLPAFSKLNPQKDREALQNVFQFSVKYAAFFVVPVTALVMCLAQPAISTLFGTTYPTAALFLTLLAIYYTFPAFGSLSTGNFLISQGKTTFLLYINLITAAIGLPMGYILIMNYGVVGLIVTSILAGIPTTIILSLYWVNKHYGLTIDWRSSAKILFSSAVAAITTHVVISTINLSSLIQLIIGLILYLFVFITVTIFTRTLNKSDFDNLRGMASGLGDLGKIISRLLTILERIMRVTKH
jgi:O-antigen/teichoic acid export membrane protein